MLAKKSLPLSWVHTTQTFRLLAYAYIHVYSINASFFLFFAVFFVLSTVASGLNALAAVTVEDFAPMVVRHIPTERETLVSKLLGNNKLIGL